MEKLKMESINYVEIRRGELISEANLFKFIESINLCNAFFFII